MDATITPFANAIASVESDGSGGYSALGPWTKNGDRAIGRYQVMASNVPQWTQDALGVPMTPHQFLNDPEAQDAVFQHRFGGYLNKYGNPQDAASAWFTGRPLAQGGNSNDGYITGNEYVRRFNAALNQPSQALAFNDTAPAASGPALSAIQGALKNGKTPMADDNTPALFGGNPTPVGGVGALARMLGIGSDSNDIGRRLQNAGAALIAINNPSGGAALQQAANMALYRQNYGMVSDAYGRNYILDRRTGAITPVGMGTGQGQPGTQGPSTQDEAMANTPVAKVERAKEQQQLYAKKMDAMEDAAAQAQSIINQNEMALRLSQSPDVVQGPGIVNMLREHAADATGGSVGGVNIVKQHELEKLNSQLVSSMLSAQKGIRFAAPEIKFGETASADTEKPAATNQQIYSNNIQNAKRIIAARDIARKHYYGRGVLDDQFSKELQSYNEANPVYQDIPAAQNSKRGSVNLSDFNPK